MTIRDHTYMVMTIREFTANPAQFSCPVASRARKLRGPLTDLKETDNGIQGDN